MDILKQAEGFEAMAVDEFPSEEDWPHEGQMDYEQLKTATVSAIRHAIKMATKAADELENGREPQARAAASIAFETLKEVLDRLG